MIIEGCTNEAYLEYWNYDPIANSISALENIPNLDDGSCSNLIVYGCTNFDYAEHAVDANVDDSSVVYNQIPTYGCMDDSSSKLTIRKLRLI